MPRWRIDRLLRVWSVVLLAVVLAYDCAKTFAYTKLSSSLFGVGQDQYNDVLAQRDAAIRTLHVWQIASIIVVFVVAGAALVIGVLIGSRGRRNGPK